MAGHAERSSPRDPSKFRPSGFITSLRYQQQYDAASQRHSKRLNKWVDPLEHETIALFEDLYHHKLFPGEEFSNNSQQPPHNVSKKACDLVTRYWEADGYSRTFLFTEMKRESGVSHEEAELQLYNYCSKHLESHGSGELVFGATPRGTKITFFVLTKSNHRVLMPLSDEMDVKNNADCDTIQYLVDAMTAWVKRPDDRRNEAAAWQLLGRNPYVPTTRGGSSSPPVQAGPRTPASQVGSGISPPRGGRHSSPHYGQNLDPRHARAPGGFPSQSGFDDLACESGSGSSPSYQRNLDPRYARDPRGHDHPPGYGPRGGSRSTSPATHTPYPRQQSPGSPWSPGLDPSGRYPAGWSRGQSPLPNPHGHPLGSSSRQSPPAPSPGRQSSRSPPERGPSPMQARQRPPIPIRVIADRAHEASSVTVLRFSQDSFENTQFHIRSKRGGFGECVVWGSSWRPAQIDYGRGPLHPGAVFEHGEVGPVFADCVDPHFIRASPTAGPRPTEWLSRGGWWKF